MTTLKDSTREGGDQEEKCERAEEEREEEQELEKEEEKRSGPGAQTQVWQRRRLGRYLCLNQSVFTMWR